MYSVLFFFFLRHKEDKKNISERKGFVFCIVSIYLGYECNNIILQGLSVIIKIFPSNNIELNLSRGCKSMQYSHVNQSIIDHDQEILR